MTRSNLGLVLAVAIAALIVTVGGVSAHGGGATTPDDGTNGSWWMGSHMGPHYGMAGSASADDVGPDACTGAWTTGMTGGGYNGMMGGSSGWGMAGSGFWALGLLWPLLFIGLLIGLGYVLVNRTDHTGRDRAFEVLRERYARGDLSDEEYASRREALQR